MKQTTAALMLAGLIGVIGYALSRPRPQAAAKKAVRLLPAIPEAARQQLLQRIHKMVNRKDPSLLHPSKAITEKVKEFEGLRLKAYKDVAAVETIGYGHAFQADEHRPQEITLEQALAYLEDDLLDASCGVSDHCHAPLTQFEFDALVDFVFNLGAERFATSTLCRLLNEGKYEQAAREFPRWCHADGHRVPGLVKRRNFEKELFLTGKY